MSKGVNKAIILGTLGKDPDVKYTASGAAVANISVATNESWKNKDTGEKVEKTEWHRIVLFGKLAEISAQYLKKGSQVYIEGKIQTRKWQDQSGQDRYSTEVVVDSFNGTMQMIGGEPQGGQQQQGGYQQNSQQGNSGYQQNNNQQQRPQQRQSTQQQQQSSQFDALPDDGFSDIPF